MVGVGRELVVEGCYIGDGNWVFGKGIGGCLKEIDSCGGEWWGVNYGVVLGFVMDVDDLVFWLRREGRGIRSLWGCIFRGVWSGKLNIKCLEW